MYPDPRGSVEGSSSSRSDRPFYPVLGQPQAQNSRPTPPPQPRQPSPPPPPPPPSPPDGASGSQNPLLRVQIAEPFRTMPPVWVPEVSRTNPILSTMDCRNTTAVLASSEHVLLHRVSVTDVMPD